MKKNMMKLLLLFGIFLFFIPSNSQPVGAWGLVVHQFVAEKAIDELDPTWQEVFDALIVKLKSGSIYPDSLHPQDTPNHLYYPSDPSYGTAPDAVLRYYNYFVANLSALNYADAVHSAGIFSHYMADVNIPVHTDDYWFGHNAFETDINGQLSTLTLGTITIDTDIPDIKQYVVDAATNAHQYYDDVRSIYVDGSVTGQISTNATLKLMVESQLTRAISNVASLFLKGLGDTVAPDVTITSTQKALIDFNHSNDYTTSEYNGAPDSLQNIENYLVGLGFAVTKDTDGITFTDLQDVDFLIVPALGTNFTTDELNAVSDWMNEGRRSVFVTGCGDFNDFSNLGMNDLLETLGTVIRMNDDNVYTNSAADPNYYKDHYLYTEVTTPPPGKSYIDQAVIYHSYSPNSLYFSGSSDNLTVLVNGSAFHYQTDQNAPAPQKIWDDTNDQVGGEAIPIVASEQVGDDRIIGFGATDFSDFSFGPSGFHDDDEFLPTFIEWVLFDAVGEGITFTPPPQSSTVSSSSTSTSSSTAASSSSSSDSGLATSPWFFMYSIPVLLVLYSIRKRK